MDRLSMDKLSISEPGKAKLSKGGSNNGRLAMPAPITHTQRSIEISKRRSGSPGTAWRDNGWAF